MPLYAIVDAGPLYAWADAGDTDHAASMAALAAARLTPVLAAFAVAEAAYLIGERLGAVAEIRFIRSIRDFPLEGPSPEDLSRMAELMAQSADFPLGAADASIVALAERLNTDTIITLDQRHFGAMRPRHCESLRLLPE